MTEFRRGGLTSSAASARLDWDEVAETLDLDAALEALDVDEAREYRGERWAYCPLPDHPGRDASGTNFSVKEDGLVWSCFTCDEGGKLPDLAIRLRRLEDLPGDSAWQQALRWLAQFSDVAPDGDEDEVYSKRMSRLARDVGAWGERETRSRPRLPVFPPGALDRYEYAPLELLERWHVADEGVVREFGLRYDPEHTRHGHTGPAILIPHVFRGQLVGYQERWLEEDRPKELPKYSNTRDFPKADSLYNFDRAAEASRRGERVGVVESVMTVVRLACIGVAATGTFGVNLPDSQLRLLATLRGGVALSSDNDAPGRKYQRRLAAHLAARVPVDVVPLVGGAKGDLADLPDGEALAAWEGAYSYGGSEPIRGER
jgi:hypothetical protein